MPRGLDSSLPLKGFGPSKDGRGFGKIARDRQAVRDHLRGLPEQLLPTMPVGEDLAAVEQLIKESGKAEKMRRRRKYSKDSTGSSESMRQRVGRAKSTPLLGGASGARGTRDPDADEKSRRRTHRTPEPEPLTRRQFEVACEALHLPSVPGAQPKPGQPTSGVWFDQLGSRDKMAMRRVLERNGARAAIIVAELPAETEKSVQERVQTRVSAEKDAFQIVLDRNRRVRSQNGRASDGRSRRARLLDPMDSATSEEEDRPSKLSRSGNIANRKRLHSRLTDGDKLSMLGDAADRADPNRLWIGHIPDEVVEAGQLQLEQKLRNVCRLYGTVTDVTAHLRFDDPDCSRVDDQSWAIVTFAPNTMIAFMEILRSQPRLGDAVLKVQLANEDELSDQSNRVDFSLSPELCDDAVTDAMARSQIEARKDEALDDELPDIGEEGPSSSGIGDDTSKPSQEAVQQWIARINDLIDNDIHTLKLPGYGMGEGGSNSLLEAIATIEKIDIDVLRHHLHSHGEVPQPSHVFRKLILSSNSLTPTDEQTAAAVGEGRTQGGSPGKISPRTLKNAHNKFQVAKTGVTDQPEVVDFVAQAKELRKSKDARKKRRLEAANRIRTAYLRKFGRSSTLGALDLVSAQSNLDAPPKMSGIDNAAVLLSLYVGNIRKLDLSDNPLGMAGGQIIAKSLDGHCPVKLKRLLLNDCKLTDQGAGHIIAVVLEQAPALTHLDLRKNALGNDQRGDRGASAALHDLFVEGCCELRVLNLGYNNLRPQHIRYFAPALQEERTLLHLDLSWNSLGNDGAMWLAHGLRTNVTLTSLDVTHNEIAEKGCFVIADMLKENRGLERFVLDENPIGERGARAILRTIRKLILFDWRREISVANCNMYYRAQGEKIFDPQEAGGPHVCNLADPYGRSVAWGLVELAWDEDGENWIGETYDGKPYNLEEPPPGEIWTRDRFQLPANGELSLTYFSTMRQPRYSDVIQDQMLHKLLILMTSKSVTDGGVKLLKLAAREFFFAASMVGNLICLMKDSVSRAEVACSLIPRIVDPVNIISQTFDVLTNGELATVEKNMGKLFHFNPVNPTGHYTLQLANSFDRVLIRRLAEVTEEQGFARREQELLDTSQKGDWDNFRNETLNGQPYDFDVEILSAGALGAGVLEFDFVSTDCNHRIALLPPMPDAVFELFMDDLWHTRDKVKVANGSGTNSLERPFVQQKPFQALFPKAELALRKSKNQRDDEDVHTLVNMLRELEFPIKQLAAVQRMCTVAEYVQTPAGTTIARKDTWGDDIFILLHGVVKIVDDDTKICMRIKPGQFFGEMSHLSGTKKRTRTMKAESDIIMMQLKIEDLNEVNFDLQLFNFRAVREQKGIQACLFVDIVSATDLLAMDKSGYSDPYITCALGSHVAATSVKKQTLNPEWGEQLELMLDKDVETLRIECFDWDLRGGDDPMGSGSIELTTLGNETSTVKTQLLLDGERVGVVTVRLRRWEPKFTREAACLILQSNFRAYTSRVKVRKMRQALPKMEATALAQSAMSQERVRQRAEILRKRQDILHQQSWSPSASIDASNGSPRLSAASSGVEKLAAASANQPRTGLNVLAIYSSDSDEEDMMGPTPKSDASATRKSGIKDRIDWSGADWMERLREVREKQKSRTRTQWFVPSMSREEVVSTMKEKRAVVFERCQQLIRRASVQYHFSSTQVARMLETVYDDDTYKDNILVGKPVGMHHVELLTSVFSRITDLENMDFREVLGHTTYDADGNHSVSVDEIVYLRQNPPPYVILTDRLGVANLFNPLLPDGEYALNLRVRDERQVAQMLVLLSTEPGDNMLYETFNGVPFDVGAKWLQAVPDVGWFCLEYFTPPACASLKLRTSLARRLVNPGKGRWVCIPREQRMHRDDPMGAMWQGSDDKSVVIEDELDLPNQGEYMIDADGTLTLRNNANMAALEEAAKEQKQRRKEARKAQEMKLAAMAEEDREAAQRMAADEKASVLGRSVSAGNAGKWVSYTDVKAAAAALRLPPTDVIKAARGHLDSVGGYEFTYAEKSKKQGLSVGVLLSLTRIKKKFAKKAELPSRPERAVESAGPSAPAVDLDDVQAVLEIAKTVDTAKMHWRRLRRVTRMMMLLRTSGAVGAGGPKLGALAKMMKK